MSGFVAYQCRFDIDAPLLNVAIGRVMRIATWISATGALAALCLAILLLFLAFIVGVELIARLFPKKRSMNVIGRLSNPSTERASGC